ncbi:zinc-binding dehydrogenase [Goodfellowiella coeruleoviolacea]|uniref:NADPH:quinone reductase n=1 Tax=Goodfellowiella coeruleoviolacea TaxID=334858 RepID=A0AAE3KED3_9PSEU|nr:zinc-binding dehydrogenase [Goodfellowiella coeruleoviolacea]MCP2165216.1 NADPH:quinone reductase [Goodfellowiella coeruleoviolacea]
MRALVHDPSAFQGLGFAEVPEPLPARSQVLIEVHAVSLNFAELAFKAERCEPGEILGGDAAGVVRQAAADGSGPAVGTRVTTFDWRGGWGELRAVDTANLAVVPDSVDLGAASALPVAGVTALQALRGLGSVLGRRVLVTGASGGVGRFAVQLAARAGAHVIAAVGSAARGQGLAELGAAEVVVGLENVTAPVFGVLDNVGGDLLAEAFALVEPGGSVQSIGNAARRPTVIDFERERLRGGGRRIEPFVVSTPFGPDLAHLVTALERGWLDPQIGWRTGWDRAAEAAEALLARRVAGKAVLDVR